MTASPTAAKATLREWTGLAVLALPSLLVSIDVSVMILALPRIGASLSADSAQQLWIMDVYGFMLAGFMITMGTLGDRIGRRRLLMIGGAGFGLASILAAFAPSAELLIIARALLGIAGATIAPSILALISNMFRDEAERGFAISIWMVSFMGGMTVGPLVGGLLLEHFWWGSVFLLGVPAMVPLLLAGPFLLPEYRNPGAGRIDLASVGLSLLTILPVIFGLKEIAKHGVEPMLLAAVAAGIAFGVLFVLRQRRLADPLFDLRLFGNRGFTTAVIAMFGITTTGAIMLFNSQYLQLVLGLSPLLAGLWTIPGVATMVVMLLVAPMVAKRVRPAPLIAAGLMVATVGALMFTQTGTEGGLAMVAVGFMLFNGGCAPMVTLGNGIVMSSVAPEKAGSAAALSETSSELGFSLGIAALGSIGTAVYRSGVAGSVPPLAPATVAEAARDTLAGAVAAVDSLPAGSGAGLRAAASGAFLDGYHVAATICAATLVCVAVLAWSRFRHLRPLGEAQRADGLAGAAGEASAS